MKTQFNEYDIVRLNPNSERYNDETASCIGIVVKPSTERSFVQFYNAKTNTSTKENTDLSLWILNSDLDLVGDLYHMLTNTCRTNTEAAQERLKNNSAKITNKRREAVSKAKENDNPKEDVIVPSIVDHFGDPIDNAWLNDSVKYIAVLGSKFNHFNSKAEVVYSIENSCKSYAGLRHRFQTQLNGGLNLAIVGDNPNEKQQTKLLSMRIPMISEEQWLALIGAPGFKFDPNNVVATSVKDLNYMKFLNYKGTI